MSDPPRPAAPEGDGRPDDVPDGGQAATDRREREVTVTDTSHIEWSALPDLGDEADRVEQVPDENPPPEERQPPPETLWGVI